MNTPESEEQLPNPGNGTIRGEREALFVLLGQKKQQQNKEKEGSTCGQSAVG